MAQARMDWKLAAGINIVAGSLFLWGALHLQGIEELVLKSKGGPNSYQHFAGASLDLLRTGLQFSVAASAVVLFRVFTTRRAELGPVFGLLFGILVASAAYCLITASRLA